MKICLVGSSRFMDRYLEVNRRLSLAGHVVYSIATRSTSADYANGTDAALSPDEKETLDLVHLRKIQESEAVYLITDADCYIGESTKREIKWAYMNGIDVYVGNHALDEHLTDIDFQARMKDMQEAVRKDAARSPYDCRKPDTILDGLGTLLSGNGPDFVVMMGRRPESPPPKPEDLPA